MSERTYKIGEAAQLLNLKSYVLRFWETEFSQLNPLRTEKGQRLYSEADLELLKFIRHLLHERGLTIEGARKVLQSRVDGGDLGLSSELLDEGYKDFGLEGLIPPTRFDSPDAPGLEAASADPASVLMDAQAGAHLVAKVASQKLALDYAIQELKDIESLLRSPNLPE